MAKKLMRKDYIDSRLLIRRNVISSAIAFKKLLGNYVLYVFDDNTHIEAFYRRTSFAHLTGVGTDLNAAEFYQKAISNQISIDQFKFGELHPYDLAKKKTSRLSEINKFITNDLIALQNVTTESKTFKFGLTDTDLTLCFSENLDKNTGEKIDDYYIPASFRVEDESTDRSNDCKFVKYLVIKKIKNSGYPILSYGEFSNISKLPENIKDKLDVELLKESTIA